MSENRIFFPRLLLLLLKNIEKKLREQSSEWKFPLKTEEKNYPKHCIL